MTVATNSSIIHAALVIHIGILIALNPDPEEAMFWCLFLSILVIDFPVSLCIFALPPSSATSAYLIAIPILFLGTIQWGMIGIVLQKIVNWFRRGNKAEIDDELPILIVARWTARIIGTLLLLLIAAFAMGEGVPNPLQVAKRDSAVHRHADDDRRADRCLEMGRHRRAR